MEYHGLTDRFPKILYLTRPAPAEWRRQASARMLKDFGERLQIYLDSGLPKLLQPKITRLGQTSIHVFERSQLGAFRLVAGSSLRVATVGRVFLEMIREPAQCGGIQHVIDVYRREAARYLSLIIDEMNQHGLAIDKVRAGFLLSEVCGLNHEAFVDWEKSAQRGGSRKLDPEGEYVPNFSERWKLSLNVPSLVKVG
jgi:predicted transcriptional regulator of viral defense system